MTVQVPVDGALPISPNACRVIAEAGVNHNNSVPRAIEMARRAAEAGAWGIKFQLYKADNLAVADSPKYWTDDSTASTQYESFQLADKLDYGDYREIAVACQELGIVFFATPFDFEAVEALEELGTPLYKIASADITHRPLIEAVAETGKPLLLSTGASEVDEISRAIEWSGLGPDRLVLLICTLTYPTPARDANFARIEEFRRVFDPYLCGCSDHTLGTAGAWLAAASGGVCIEKHYTLDPSLPDVPDHAMSVTPPQLAEMVRACEEAAVLRGTTKIGVIDSELPARRNARRSLSLERDVPAGHQIQREELDFKRPGTGLPPFELDRVVGRRARRPLSRGHLLREEDLE